MNIIERVSISPRREVIGDAELWLGDCREIAPTLGTINAVITDPPYEAEAHTPMRRTRRTAENGGNDMLSFAAIDEETRLAVAKVAAIQCSGWALFFCQVEAVSAWRFAVEAHGAKYKRAMVWVKPDSSPQFNGQGPAQGHETIVAAWCGEGASNWNGGGRRGVFEHSCRASRDGNHPTEKPILLMKDLVFLFSRADDLVLDCFMGSGTTGVACLHHSRRFIGIEADQSYFSTACRRIEAEARQGKLF